MKLFFIPVVLLLSIISGTAQVVRFTDTTNKWDCYVYRQEGSTIPAQAGHTHYHYGNDTLIGTMLYHLLQGRDTLAIREDTAAGKIWFRFVTPTFFYTGVPTDTTEHLLFDYGFVPGDTLKIDFGSTHSWNRVGAITTHSINGIFHRAWRMAGANAASDNYYFIEGIGSTQGTEWQIVQSHFLTGSQIQCFTNSGGPGTVTPSLPVGIWIPETTSHYTPAPVWDFDNFLSCKNALRVRNPVPNDHLLFPNPVTAKTTLSLPTGSAPFLLVLTTAQGTVIRNQWIKPGESFRPGESLRLPGIYVYSIHSSDGRTQRGKFIFK